MPGVHPAPGRIERDFPLISPAGRDQRPADFVCKRCVGNRLGFCVDRPAVRGYNLPRCGRSVDGSGMRRRMDASDATDRQEISHESPNIDLVQDRGAAPRCGHDARKRHRLRVVPISRPETLGRTGRQNLPTASRNPIRNFANRPTGVPRAKVVEQSGIGWWRICRSIRAPGTSAEARGVPVDARTGA